MSYYCWRCSRRLDILQAPIRETVTVRCRRCKASCVVQAGHDPAEEISVALDNVPARMIQSGVTTA